MVRNHHVTADELELIKHVGLMNPQEHPIESGSFELSFPMDRSPAGSVISTNSAIYLAVGSLVTIVCNLSITRGPNHEVLEGGVLSAPIEMMGLPFQPYRIAIGGPMDRILRSDPFLVGRMLRAQHASNSLFLVARDSETHNLGFVLWENWPPVTVGSSESQLGFSLSYIRV